MGDAAARADMRIEVVKREINQGALAGFDSTISDYAARLIIAALDSFDEEALKEEFRRGFEAGELNTALLLKQELAGLGALIERVCGLPDMWMAWPPQGPRGFIESLYDALDGTVRGDEPDVAQRTRNHRRLHELGIARCVACDVVDQAEQQGANPVGMATPADPGMDTSTPSANGPLRIPWNREAGRG